MTGLESTRAQAAALGSVRAEGGQPGPEVEALLAAWGRGELPTAVLAEARRLLAASYGRLAEPRCGGPHLDVAGWKGGPVGRDCVAATGPEVVGRRTANGGLSSGRVGEVEDERGAAGPLPRDVVQRRCWWGV